MLTSEELETERITLEREERKNLSEVNILETAMKKEFERGIGKPFAQKRAISHKVEQLRMKLSLNNRNLNQIHLRLNTINNLANALEMKETLVARGIWAKLKGLSKENLENALSEMYLEEDQLAATLQRISDTFSVSSPFSEDEYLNEDEKKLFDAWKMAEKGMNLDEALAEYETVVDGNERIKDGEIF